MDGHWHQSYEPTIQSRKFRPPSLDVAAGRLREATANIEAAPYNPRYWHERSRVLLTLGFPELAVGDTHKATLPLQSSTLQLERTTTTTATDVFTTLIKCLRAAHAYEDARAVYLEHKAACFDDAGLDAEKTILQPLEQDIRSMQARLPQSMPDEDREALLKIGHVLVRNYPWMTTEQLQRSSVLRRIVNDQVKQLTSDYAELAVTNLRGVDTNVWGVQATKPIPSGRLLMSEEAPFAAVDMHASLQEGISLRCTTCCLPISTRGMSKDLKLPCGCRFCSATCRYSAESTFHNNICPTTDCPVNKLHHGVPPRPATRLNLFRRYLTALVLQTQVFVSPSLDPLKLPLIARLTPNTGGPETHAFNYHDHIVYPTLLLQKLGIDIYTAHHFDTWVLLTIRRRIDNNNYGNVVHAVYPCMAMFNHSCEPNVGHTEDEEGRAVLSLKTLRRIEEGEELFLRYTEGGVEEGLGARRYSLYHCLGTDCRCSRCVREEGEVPKVVVE